MGSGFVDSTFLALGPPGVGVRAMNFVVPSFHEGDRTTIEDSEISEDYRGGQSRLAMDKHVLLKSQDSSGFASQ
jgi:hypothetical protein